MRRVGSKIVLEGELLRPMDQAWIQRFTNEYSGITDNTRLHPTAARIGIHYLQEKLRASGYASVRASVSGATLFLEGSVPTQIDAIKAEAIAKSIFPTVESGTQQ